MGIKFIDLRNTTGRASSVAIVDGTGSGTAAVRIIGALVHGDEFTFREFDRFAEKYLEVRRAMPEEPWPLYRVGHNDRGGPFATFRTAEAASEFIGSTLRRDDPDGVDAGDYYIDGPGDLEALDPDAQGCNGDESTPQYADPYIAGIMARADSFPVIEPTPEPAPKPRLKYPDCPSCVNYAASDGYGPSHEGSIRCESKSIASGGSRAHCSCDTCW